MTRSIAQAITAGVAALARMQAPDGSFPLWVGTARWRPCGPLFSTAYIMMGAGALLPDASIARAIDYIRGQRRPDGLWEYDPAIGIPPDSDSTACSLASLVLHGDRSDLVGGADLLRLFWRTGAGPFRSWKAPGMWSLPERDDPVVNCNILFALRLLGSPATSTETTAVLGLLKRAGGSRYYCSPATIAHAARRSGLAENALPPAAMEQPRSNDLLGVVQWLCGLPAPTAALIDPVLAAQRPDGSWPIWPWVMADEKPKPFWGSPAITTALALEALGRAGVSPPL